MPKRRAWSFHSNDRETRASKVASPSLKKMSSAEELKRPRSERVASGVKSPKRSSLQRVETFSEPRSGERESSSVRRSSSSLHRCFVWVGGLKKLTKRNQIKKEWRYVTVIVPFGVFVEFHVIIVRKGTQSLSKQCPKVSGMSFRDCHSKSPLSSVVVIIYAG